jgi:arsenic resistance protein ArsH
MAIHTSSNAATLSGHGDLNNRHASRIAADVFVDSSYSHRCLAIRPHEDDADIRSQYRPFLLPEQLTAQDWVAKLELGAALKMVQTEILGKEADRLRILVLYGSLRQRFVLRPQFASDSANEPN